MAAEQGRVDLSAAVEDDVIELDAGRLLEEVVGDGIGATQSCPAHRDFRRVGLGVGDNLLHRFIFRCGVHDQRELVEGKIGDRGEIFQPRSGILPHQRWSKKG